MPLTEFQQKLAALLAGNRTEDSYLAGGAAIHSLPNTKRYSNDLDFFHDSEERVGEAFHEDRALLVEKGFTVELEMNQPGYIRALVSKGKKATKVEWAHDSSWRFLPTVKVDNIGYQLAPEDLAVNKVLAIAGRDEARDYLDVLHYHEELLPLGALVWAACGKDPGFTPSSLLELLKRRGKYRPEDFQRLNLAESVNLVALKSCWLSALESAEHFVTTRPPSELGCLYYLAEENRFVAPDPRNEALVSPHFGRPGGVLPQVDSST